MCLMSNEKDFTIRKLSKWSLSVLNCKIDCTYNYHRAKINIKYFPVGVTAAELNGNENIRMFFLMQLLPKYIENGIIFSHKLHD